MKREIKLHELESKFLIKALQKKLKEILGKTEKEEKKRIVINKLINELSELNQVVTISKSQAKIINRIVVDTLDHIENNILPEYKNRLTKALHKGKIDYTAYIDKTETMRLLLMNIKKALKGLL